MHCKSLWIKESAKCINVNVSLFKFSEANKLEIFEYKYNFLFVNVFLDFKMSVYAIFEIIS